MAGILPPLEEEEAEEGGLAGLEEVPCSTLDSVLVGVMLFKPFAEAEREPEETVFEFKDELRESLINSNDSYDSAHMNLRVGNIDLTPD
ncbi:hypothetical protein HDU96_001080 [Phlyctochytrium bullatum]|nr:hypothetical protein HDU96_001080 [Phlyctochytrium bullatum]